MKTKLGTLIGLAVIFSICRDMYAQGTAFTYQGQLNSSGNPAIGSYDFRFKLFVDSFGNTQAGTTVLTNGLHVTNGLFTVAIDFGSGIFNGTSYWLEVGVRTNGGSSYTSLAPLQSLSATPYSVFANSASNAATANVAVTSTTATTATTASAVGANGVNSVAIQNNAVTAAKIAGGQVVKSVNGLQDAVTLSGGNNITITPSGQTLTIAASGGGWSLTGNAATTPGVNFVGTTDNQPLELWVNSSRALRLEPNANGPNVIGGFSGNSVGGGAYGVTIAGGGVVGSINQVSANVSTIGGGFLNTVQASSSTIAGGYNNTIQSTSSGSSIGGGEANVIQNIYGTIPGGYGNAVTGPYSFAAGKNATASGFGSFVWSDGNAATTSTGDHQFVVRCTGGAIFYTANGTSTGVQLASGGGSWSSLSDRNVKEDFTPVDPKKVLEKVAQMPVTTWNYIAQGKTIRHIGPMAQDFYAGFNVGEDERHITTIDEGGVALAAIQGLNMKLQEKDAEIQALKERLEKLERAQSSSTGNH